MKHNLTKKKDIENKHKKVPIDVKKIIVKLKAEGKSYTEISKIVNRPRPTIQSVVKNFEKNNSYDIAIGRGRKKVLTARDERVIERMVKADPKIGAPQIATNLEESGGPAVNPQTIRNLLHTKGYKGCVARRKPFISKKNALKRLEYVNKPDAFWTTKVNTIYLVQMVDVLCGANPTLP